MYQRWPPTLAFSIKKTTSAPALNPPAPLVFGDDVDEDDNESDDQRQKQSDRKDRDDRIKRWDKPVGVTPVRLYFFIYFAQ
ncbi:hypothetical protein ANCCAN_26232 [Ancylostoma caninum]|uniref:Uncharacterized protein n=1 Tax=Ancylostoma caninum TaxID=29170 RepID=A0A368F7K0_ANCCA|nr:hypothetical protein ANCCAN_26232 [Ancylostoma caninum]